MAELSTLARPYAKAAYEYAVEGDALDSWSAMLKTLTAVVQHSAVKALLDSPERSTQQQGESLVEICGDALDGKGRNLIGLLAKNRRLALIPYIGDQFEVLKAQREKTVDVQVVAASELDTAQQEKLSQALSRRLDRRVNMTVSIDKSLLGGVLIRAGDTVIDGSIRGRLTKLAEALNS